MEIKRPSKLREFLEVLSVDKSTDSILQQVCKRATEEITEVFKREKRRGTNEPAQDKVEVVLRALSQKTQRIKFVTLKEIVAFGEVMRPDLTCVTAGKGSRSLYIIESQSFTVQSMATLIQQLRHLCLADGRPQAHGILTDFDKWTIVRYDLA